MPKSVGEKHIPMRMCFVTRQKKSKKELGRFVLEGKTGKIMFDRTGRISGRGANMTLSKETFEQAVKNSAFNRVFKKKVDNVTIDQLRSDFFSYLDSIQEKKESEPKVVRVVSHGVKL